MLRFRNVAYSVGATVALAVDTILIIGAYSLCYGWVPFSLEIDQTFIGAILTAIGYSFNDKVVIFDRIRDALKKHHAQTKAAYKEIVNKSIAQTMSRSVNTSITTFVMVLVLYIMGVTSIREFALPLMVGLLAGTYSSICLASEIWYLLRTKGMKKE